MIEVHMGQKNVVNYLRRKPELRQRGKETGQRVVVGGIDNRNAALFDNQMHGGQPRAHVASVYGMDVMGPSE
jgi:hypothetical protein